MAVKPMVRYMILCEDWGMDPNNPKRVNIYGLLSNVRSLEQLPYPLLYRELCVLLILTEIRGTGAAQIIGVFEETGEEIFVTAKRQVSSGSDPLEVVGLPFRIRNIRFPRAGMYSIQFWYNDKKVEERPLCLR
jgi:hypothetical protein